MDVITHVVLRGGYARCVLGLVLCLPVVVRWWLVTVLCPRALLWFLALCAGLLAHETKNTLKVTKLLDFII